MTFALSLRPVSRLDVLFVDDNPFMRAAIVRILRRSGRQSLAVPSLGEAKVTILEHPPALVLTNYSTGKSDTGLDLVRWVRAQPGLESTACGLMTSVDRGQLSRALSDAGLGALPVLPKPFSLADLESWIDELLGAPPVSPGVSRALRRFGNETPRPR